jgi:hypothetical protein
MWVAQYIIMRDGQTLKADQKRINELFLEIDLTEKKIEETNSLMKFESKNENESQALRCELLNYALYQLMDLKNNYTIQLDVLIKQEMEHQNQLVGERENLHRKLEKIEHLNKQMKDIKAIQMISSPKSNNTPMKNNMYLSIFLSAASGFITMVLLSLIIDFLVARKIVYPNILNRFSPGNSLDYEGLTYVSLGEVKWRIDLSGNDQSYYGVGVKCPFPA